MCCKNDRCYLDITILFILLTMLTACSKPAINKSLYTTDYIGKAQLFANVDLNSNSISKLSTTNMSSSEDNFTFKMNDLDPELDVNTYFCGTSMSAEFGRHQKEDDRCDRKLPFRASKIQYGDIFVDTASTLGFGTLFYLISGPPRYIYFDHVKYNNAVNTALTKSNVDRFKYVDSLDAATIRINNIRYASIAKINEPFIKLYDNISRQYNSINDRIIVKPIVTDKSGLYKYNTDFTKYVHIFKNELPVQSLTNQVPTYTIEIESDPDKFMTAIESHINKASVLYESEESKYNEMHDKYKSTLNELSSYYNVRYDNNISINGFDVSISGDSTIKASANNKITVPAAVTINYLNPIDIYPYYKNEDKNMSVISDGKNISIINKTKEFIQIRSISVYYNNKISTKTLDSAIELPPDAVNEHVRLSDIVNSEIRSLAHFTNIDAKKAKQTNINFGLAVKYRLADQNMDKTIYNTNTYNLLNLLAPLI